MANLIDKIKDISKFFAKPEFGIEIEGKANPNGSKKIPLNSEKQETQFIKLKILSCTPRFQKEISQMPIEGSKIINDNTILMPEEVSLKILLTEFDSSFLVGNVINSMFSSETKLKSALTTLINTLQQARFCKIKTKNHTFENMQFADFSYTEDAQNGGKYLICDLVFKEILTFDILNQTKKKAATSNVEIEKGSNHLKSVFNNVLSKS